jgi:hypothetical protein
LISLLLLFLRLLVLVPSLRLRLLALMLLREVIACQIVSQHFLFRTQKVCVMFSV